MRAKKKIGLIYKEPSEKELFGIAHSFLENDFYLPLPIFNEKLTTLESIVKYLKEERHLSLHSIAKVIKRDERNVWHIYDRSKKKYSKPFVIKKIKFWVSISIFSGSTLSAQESLVSSLKDNFNLTYREIGILLSRNERTIWTVYQRGKKKR